MTMNKLASAAVGLLSLALSGCASSKLDDLPADEWGIERQREWDELNRQKADLRWNYDAPVHFSFPGNGDVTVRRWALEGGPGWEYVRARFTYENTTDRPMELVDIELHVLDDRGETVVASRRRLTHPWGLPLMPGTLFSDEIKVPTHGQHRDRRGWHWTVECRGREELSN
jgi:hypothetical protein